MSNTRPPNREPIRSVWSSKDEANLQELIERKQRILAANREPLRTLVCTLPRTDIGVCEDHVDWLINNAEALRDALDPFDSHTRAAS